MNAPLTTTNQFAQVILPLAVPNAYTYQVPAELQQLVRPGVRVVVQFGAKRVYTAIVASLTPTPPQHYKVKPLLDVLDEQPIINPYQLQLIDWMARYYVCTRGEVVTAAIPTGLRLSSESRIQLNPDFDIDAHYDNLSARAIKLIDYLKNKDSLTYEAAANLLRVKNVYLVLKDLINLKAVFIFEQLKEKYTPQRIKRIKLHPNYANYQALQQLHKELEKKDKQLNVLIYYLQKVPVLKNPEANENGINRKDLLEDNRISASSLNTLIKKNIFEAYDHIMPRFSVFRPLADAEVTLSTHQQEALKSILRGFDARKHVVLRGITGSGKTEIYITLIHQVIDSGSQALLLLPEIALTTQMVTRLQQHFGDALGVYHSRFSDNERVEVWHGVQQGRYQIVLGVRSSVFLPFDNLGLIIIDEEHEPSYKQHQPAPRYHARDTALWLARLHSAPVLMGSATPSVEAWYLTQTGKWHGVELTQRYGKAQLPTIQAINLRQERANKSMTHEFSSEMINALRQNLEKGQQSILFINRRGYAPVLQCQQCDWVPKCPSCDVSLTYHLRDKELRCHYCGHRHYIFTSCQACGSTALTTKGYGTQKLEDELSLIIPQARIARMDLDTTRSKFAFQKFIADMENGHIQILIGTQMVTKGLDFENVTLVGVFDLDRMLHFPDFRAQERAYQLVNQVAGRAGRRTNPGKVLVQTAAPTAKTVTQILAGKYNELYQDEITERETFGYPPFSRLINIKAKHEDEQLNNSAAQWLAKQLKNNLGNRSVLGPEPPLVSKINNVYINQILLKLNPNEVSLTKVKNLIVQLTEHLCAQPNYRRLKFIVDVDPV